VAKQPKGELVVIGFNYRWDPKELAELARQLREFADSLDSQRGGKKAKKE
jgi:hypothetical protein